MKHYFLCLFASKQGSKTIEPIWKNPSLLLYVPEYIGYIFISSTGRNSFGPRLKPRENIVIFLHGAYVKIESLIANQQIDSLKKSTVHWNIT